ncbi:hypothetical protein, partial [Mesorhizobium sp.]|uniref:hypothetical protein n=1 Tax=Mesorhizobium sp. TaxID=1871066 RepID=UPI0025C64501
NIHAKDDTFRGRRHHQAGGGREKYRLSHGYSFPRFGKRSFWADSVTSTAKWDRKVSSSGSLRDHWMATMCAPRPHKLAFGSNR